MLVLACITVCKLILACKVCKAESTQKPIGTVSTGCDSDFFFSPEYRKCIPCSTCDVYSVVLSHCNSTSDTACHKCSDPTQPDASVHPACMKCPPCQAGQFVESPCEDDKPTICRPCPEGSYIGLASYKTFCSPCTSCGNHIMVQDCNASLDTVCGPCKKGYYKDYGRNLCNECKSCAPGQKAIDDCIGGAPGKLCSGYTFFSMGDLPSSQTTDITGINTFTSTIEYMIYTDSSTSLQQITSSNVQSGILILVMSASALLAIVLVYMLVICRRFHQKTHTILHNVEEDDYFRKEHCNSAYELTESTPSPEKTTESRHQKGNVAKDLTVQAGTFKDVVENNNNTQTISGSEYCENFQKCADFSREIGIHDSAKIHDSSKIHDSTKIHDNQNSAVSSQTQVVEIDRHGAIKHGSYRDFYAMGFL